MNFTGGSHKNQFPISGGVTRLGNDAGMSLHYANRYVCSTIEKPDYYRRLYNALAASIKELRSISINDEFSAQIIQIIDKVEA